jgi:PAS domain-containing protein
VSNNHKGRRTTAQSRKRDAEPRRRLEEAELTLAAIRRGAVDGLVVAGLGGEQGYSLAGTEHAYRVIVETLRNAHEDLQVRAEQLQTVTDLLEAKQQEVEQANDNLQMQEQDLRQHAEDLQTSRERLALAVSGARLGMYEWNVVTGETLWTEQVARLLGLRTTTTTISLHYHYQDWAERVHPEDLPHVEAELRRCMAEQAAYEAQYRVVWPDGVMHWIADRGVFQYESDGQCTRMLGIVWDITDQRRAEEVLRIKERAIASSLNAIAMADPQGRLTYVNPAFVKLWGYEDEGEVLGKSVLDFWKEPRQALEVMQAIRSGAGWGANWQP